MTPTKEVRGHPCQTSAWGETGKASVPEHLDTCSVRYVRAAVYIGRSSSITANATAPQEDDPHAPMCSDGTRARSPARGIVVLAFRRVECNGRCNIHRTLCIRHHAKLHGFRHERV